LHRGADGFPGDDPVGTERSLLADGARERGVDPDGVETVVLTYCHLAEGDEPAVRDAQRRAFEDMYEDVLGWEYALENCLTETVTEVQDALVAYERAGVDQLIVSPCVHDDEALRGQMNLYAEHLL